MRRITCLILFWIIMLTVVSAQQQDRPIDGRIQRLWRNPSSDYRMKTWWFFGYERTTDEGITADAEALKEAGFGGVVYYDQQHAKDASAQGAEERIMTASFAISMMTKICLTRFMNLGFLNFPG